MSSNLTTVSERFWSKVSIGAPDECWEWQPKLMVIGYGCISVNGKQTLAHRLSYELSVGPIPEGLQIDHLCRNRACQNPNHLEAVTQKVNILRGNGYSARNARKTHCKYGHEFTEANTYIRASNQRKCRTCHRINERERKQKQRAELIKASTLDN